MMGPDYTNRGYLLPAGCKDLIDVIHLEAQQKEKCQVGDLPGVPPPITSEIFVTTATTVGEMARLLGQATSAIMADLMQIGVFATPQQVIGFEAISKVARKYGYLAKRVKV
jgi:hypothetical protein